MPEFRKLTPAEVARIESKPGVQVSPTPIMRRNRSLSNRKAASRWARTWWTRERVIVGLRLFYRDFGTAPLNTHDYHTVTKGSQHHKGPRRRYPSFYAVLRYFKSFREAWTATGVDVDRGHEEWSDLEEWYLREAAGFIPRKEIARDLKRSDDAVHRRMYDLGLLTRSMGDRPTLHGWTLNQIERVTGVPGHIINGRYIKKGRLPFRRGTQCCYIDPADLVDVVEIDWDDPPAELERAARHAWLGRLATVLRSCSEGAVITRSEPRRRIRVVRAQLSDGRITVLGEAFLEVAA